MPGWIVKIICASGLSCCHTRHPCRFWQIHKLPLVLSSSGFAPFQDMSASVLCLMDASPQRARFNKPLPTIESALVMKGLFSFAPACGPRPITTGSSCCSALSHRALSHSPKANRAISSPPEPGRNGAELSYRTCHQIRLQTSPKMKMQAVSSTAAEC